MIRGVLFSVVLSAILVFAVYRIADMLERASPAPVTRVDIFADHITYRTSDYASVPRFATGLKTVNVPPQILALHDCAGTETFEAVLDILREQGFTSFSIELPRDC